MWNTLDEGIEDLAIQNQQLTKFVTFVSARLLVRSRSDILVRVCVRSRSDMFVRSLVRFVSTFASRFVSTFV